MTEATKTGGTTEAVDEGVARKARSMARLADEGVPTLDWLPPIESELETLRRTPSEVVRRAVALFVAAEVALQKAYDRAAGVIADFEAATFFTPAELAVFADGGRNEQHRIDAAWRIECVHVLLWAAGFLTSLGRPDEICDVPAIEKVVGGLGTERLLRRAMLRSQADILDELDLMYRYHWATRQASRNGQREPSGLIEGVVSERHYALNWLVGFQDADWDDVSTDT